MDLEQIGAYERELDRADKLASTAHKSGYLLACSEAQK